MSRLQCCYIIAKRLCYALLASFLLFGFLPWMITVVQSEEDIPPAPVKVPEKYVGNLQLLLEDYRAHEIQPDAVIEILILLSLERDGVFLPLEETDTYLDHYYVDRHTHEEIAEMKLRIQSFKKED